MKITMYELLGMIKNNNAPKQIKFSGMKWELKEDDYYWSDGIYLEEYCDLTKSLNDEIEILEESKKIEKIEIYEDEEGHYFFNNRNNKIYIRCDETDFMVDKFNELIDEINNIKESKYE